MLNASNASVQCWMLVLPASNTCRWLTAILKHRFRFVCCFPHFFASLACYNPDAYCPSLCFDFASCFASFFVLCPVFCVLHHFSLHCMVFRVPLHCFLPFASFSVPCTIFCIFAPFSAPALLYRLHATCIAWFSRSFVFSLASAYRAVMLTA